MIEIGKKVEISFTLESDGSQGLDIRVPMEQFDCRSGLMFGVDLGAVFLRLDAKTLKQLKQVINSNK